MMNRVVALTLGVVLAVAVALVVVTGPRMRPNTRPAPELSFQELERALAQAKTRGVTAAALSRAFAGRITHTGHDLPAFLLGFIADPETTAWLDQAIAQRNEHLIESWLTGWVARARSERHVPLNAAGCARFGVQPDSGASEWAPRLVQALELVADDLRRCMTLYEIDACLEVCAQSAYEAVARRTRPCPVSSPILVAGLSKTAGRMDESHLRTLRAAISDYASATIPLVIDQLPSDVVIPSLIRLREAANDDKDRQRLDGWLVRSARYLPTEKGHSWQAWWTANACLNRNQREALLVEEIRGCMARDSREAGRKLRRLAAAGLRSERILELVSLGIDDVDLRDAMIEYCCTCAVDVRLRARAAEVARLVGINEDAVGADGRSEMRLRLLGLGPSAPDPWHCVVTESLAIFLRGW